MTSWRSRSKAGHLTDWKCTLLPESDSQKSQGEHSTVSKEQSRQMLVPKGEFTHAAADLRPQLYLRLTGCDRRLTHPQKVRPGWVWRAEKWPCPSFQGGSLQTQQQTCAQTEGYSSINIIPISVLRALDLMGKYCESGREGVRMDHDIKNRAVLILACGVVCMSERGLMLHTGSAMMQRCALSAIIWILHM
ncbi:hypothetical protein F7725_027607 [Dissostichus mawsoni]|uniref:Uncharacterized protein n=1 Tax=Dissostichus mawsoni TaxID=36200 RepID=A0A7J5XEA4_DISMA|nr:hypothetical protein F7725_027607 [Dissostichus mawsoni]